MKFGIGQPAIRLEDVRLVRGAGHFQDDRVIPGQVYAVFVRSPHAHAKINSVDTAAAKASPGVLAVYTGQDYADDGLGMPKATQPRKRADGSPMFAPQRPAMMVDHVKYVGDTVAMVIATTLNQAKDAAELVEVDYTPLPAVTDTAYAADPSSPPIWEGNPDNISHRHERGDKAAAEAAFAQAAHVVKRRYVITRVHAQYMEPRGSLGVWDAGDERYVLYADVNYPHRVRNMLANQVFRVPESAVRVVVQDVGGGFGTKGWQYVDHRLVMWAAKKLGKPVRWTCERSEAIMADEHGRDNIGEISLAFDANGKILGLHLDMIANIGAYIASDRQLLTPFGQIATVTGVYDIPAAYVCIDAVLTNTNPTAPYRGAGRPEAIYLIERAMDDAAEELGIDRLDLRRRNMIQPEQMPYKIPLGPSYDVGQFPENMERALKLADFDGFEARRAESQSRGLLRGVSVVNAIEQAAGPQPEYAEIRFNPSGTALLMLGTKAHGQGHETVFKQILHEKIGIDPADVRYIDGDTDRVAFGMGSNGSRSMAIGGSALVLAADKIIAKGKKIAAHMLEAGEGDIEFADGVFSIAGTDKQVTLNAVARAAFLPAKLPKGMEPGFYENATYESPQGTYPNGCHVCEVEVDPETGHVQLAAYAVVDDVGTVINPTTLKGQIHGGIAQGLGQALMEKVTYDKDTGQLLSASFMDYAMPRADNFANIAIESNPVPTGRNLLGAKGAGEAGTVGALPAITNAIVDALSHLGVRHIEMPATPERIWRAIREAKLSA
jgi:carbon-monoxide dehydrogenase large subunit